MQLGMCKNQDEHTSLFRKSLPIPGDTRHPREHSQLLVYYHGLSQTYAHLKHMTYATPIIIIQRLFFFKSDTEKPLYFPLEGLLIKNILASVM